MPGAGRGERRRDQPAGRSEQGQHLRRELPTGSPARGGAVSSDGQRVLVVDDEPQIVRALKVILRGAGYVTQQAETKQEALDAVAVRPPDAMVLDLILPDGSGVDVVRELRRWSGLPVLVLSAVGDEREKVRALDAGADDYVTKPFGAEELTARLRALLRRVGETPAPVVE